MSENSPLPVSAPAASPAPTAGQRLRNLLIAAAAASLAIAIFLGLQSQPATASLTALAKASVPFDQALNSGKPTFLEFYANWCTSCQAMAGDMGRLREDYGDRVNFVMLNVDNSKWLPEWCATASTAFPILFTWTKPVSRFLRQLASSRA